MATVHPLQESVDRLPEYLTDARNLNGIGESLRAELSRARRAQGNATGAGRPDARHKSVNRAVVVAAVGALEAFCEDLALAALPLFPAAATTDQWFTIDGTKGMIQTPSPYNIGKLFWLYFRYDPRPDWDLLVTNGLNETTPGTTRWRTGTTAYNSTTATTAVDALSAMVKVRHGFAHQDPTSSPAPVPGVVAKTAGGKLSLQSHHAFNAMSMVAQVAIQTTLGLAAEVSGHTEKFKWRKGMTDAGLDTLLSDSEASKAIKIDWIGSPF